MGLFKRKQPAGTTQTMISVQSKTIDASGVEGLGDEIMHTLHEHGIEPGQNRVIDASTVPGLGEEIMQALNQSGVFEQMGEGTTTIEGTESELDPVAQLEKLAHLHKTGVLTDWEFDAAKKKLLNET